MATASVVEAKNPIFEFFHTVTVQDVIAEKKTNTVIALKLTDSIEAAVKALNQNHLLSAPVFDDKNEFVGFVDMVDILRFIVKASPTPWSIQQDELASLKIAGRAISLVPLTQVVNLSEKDPMLIIQASAPASNLIKIFSHGFHRAAVFEKKQIVNIVTQSDAVQFLSKHLHTGKLKEIGTQSLTQLGYSSSQVVTISQNATVVDVLKQMSTAGVGQIALVDEASGRLIGNFSASDVKALYREDFPHLLDSARHFLGKHHPSSLQPICGVPKSSLIDIVNEMVKSKLHHMWVLDGDFKPCGIVTLTDIMKICHSNH